MLVALVVEPTPLPENGKLALDAAEVAFARVDHHMTADLAGPRSRSAKRHWTPTACWLEQLQAET